MLLLVTKRMTFDAAHRLPSSEDSPECERLHGHTWAVEATWKANTLDLNGEGMTVNFKILKDTLGTIVGKFDHAYLNDLLDFPTTAERLAEHIAHQLAQLTLIAGLPLVLDSVRLYETPNNWVEVYP